MTCLLVLSALILRATAAAATCELGEATKRIRVTLQPPEGIEVAAVVVSLSYPADKLGIEGRGPEAGRSAVRNTPPGAVTASDDMDGELRQVVAKPTPLPEAPLFEVTLRRCVGGADVSADEVACRVLDASDPKSTKVPGVRCGVRFL